MSGDAVATAWPWPAPADCGGARHLRVGVAVPDLALASTRGGEESLARLGGTTVAFFYPWAGRPGVANPPGWDDIPGAHGSTPEAERFRDLHERFAANAVRVRGVSGQEAEHQVEFAQRLGLPFALLSDCGLLLARALALPTFETGGVTYLKRLTLVIRDGVVLACFFPVHPPDVHAAEVLAWLDGSVV